MIPRMVVPTDARMSPKKSNGPIIVRQDLLVPRNLIPANARISEEVGASGAASSAGETTAASRQLMVPRLLVPPGVRIGTAAERGAASAPVGALQFSRAPLRTLDLNRSLLDFHRMPSKAPSSMVGYSIVVHAILLAAALLAPMWFADTLDLRTYTRTMLVSAPPPPAPGAPSSAVARAAVRSTPMNRKGQFLLPVYIPKEVATINEPQLAPEEDTVGVPGGVLGGVPGGVIGGVLGASLVEAKLPIAPVAPAAAASAETPKEPLRVGGSVKPPRILSQAAPVYPLLARRAMLQGVVVISAVIDTHGDVVEMKLVSGHPMLFQAAMNALRAWKFEPTYLNGELWPVSWDITITFRLN
jgi:periplasmic protein TonB